MFFFVLFSQKRETFELIRRSLVDDIFKRPIEQTYINQIASLIFWILHTLDLAFDNLTFIQNKAFKSFEKCERR